MSRRPRQRGYRISAVAERYRIHPQTLRMYERQGLLTPSRSAGNTRIYDDEDLRDLEVILHLTRDLDVNLAGVEVVLNMRRTILRLRRNIRHLEQALPDGGSTARALIPLPGSRSLQPVGRRPVRYRDIHPIDSSDS